VARDYIFQGRPQLGDARIGPDLANWGGRKPPVDAAGIAQFLHSGVVSGAKAVTHPPFPFLFDDRPIVGEAAPDALVGVVDKTPRRQIVPTERARTLIAYLQSLNNAYEYPEARHVVPGVAKEGAHK
jgi:cytochrome c oxidase cbb3-type subunit 2